MEKEREKEGNPPVVSEETEGMVTRQKARSKEPDKDVTQKVSGPAGGEKKDETGVVVVDAGKKTLDLVESSKDGEARASRLEKEGAVIQADFKPLVAAMKDVVTSLGVQFTLMREDQAVRDAKLAGQLQTLVERVVTPYGEYNVVVPQEQQPAGKAEDSLTSEETTKRPIESRETRTTKSRNRSTEERLSYRDSESESEDEYSEEEEGEGKRSSKSFFRPTAPHILTMKAVKDNPGAAFTHANSIRTYCDMANVKRKDRGSVYLNRCDVEINTAVQALLMGIRLDQGDYHTPTPKSIRQAASWVMRATGTDPGIEAMTNLMSAQQGTRTVREWTAYIHRLHRLTNLSSKKLDFGGVLAPEQLKAKLAFSSNYALEFQRLLAEGEGRLPKFETILNLLETYEKEKKANKPPAQAPQRKVAAHQMQVGKNGGNSGGNSGTTKKKDPAAWAKKRREEIEAFQKSLTDEDRALLRNKDAPWSERKKELLQTCKKCGLCYTCTGPFGACACKKDTAEPADGSN